ncbi:MAG: alpha/beta hydrolase [Burkholderiales bacterium]|nr:alpha/beta hydrolase [Burkholderiales bacterium]
MPQLSLPDGTRIAYDEYNFTPPWTSPSTVILVHGFNKNRRFWWDWIPALARHYRLISLDQRGHGESSLPPQDFVMGLEPFADDLVAVLDKLGIDSATFVMAEFSSSVAIDLASRYPDRVRSLVLPGFGYNWQASKTVNWNAWADIAEREGTEVWSRQTTRFRLPADADPALSEWYTMQQARMPGWLLAKVFRFVGQTDLSARLDAVKVPALIIAGSESQQDTLESMRKGVAKMARAELVVLQGAPFNVMNARPTECVAATLEFLGRNGR